MDIPVGQHIYTHSNIENPGLNIDPASTRPFVLTNILGLDLILTMEVSFNAFTNPVDIYLAISYSGLPNDIFLIDPSNELQKNKIVPWRTNQTVSINNELLFDQININDLQKGIYTLYALVVPAGAKNMNNSYLWITNFKITH